MPFPSQSTEPACRPRWPNFVSFGLLILFALAAPAAFAGDAALESLTATAGGGYVTVSVSMRNAFDNSELEKALTSGLPTGFTYHLELVRRRPKWFDDGIAESTIEVVCTFNSVTQEYLLNYRRDRKLVRSETYSDLATLKRSMTTIREENLFPIGNYRANKLVVRARADVMRGFLLYVIPWDFSTHWVETRVAGANGR